MGRGILEGTPRTERVQLETRSSDPANPSVGEAWLRTDLTGTDKVGELRWFDGASTNAVDVVTPGTTSSPVEEVLRIQTPNGKGVIKTAPRNDATYPEWSLQHAGSPLGLGYSAIPDSVEYQFAVDDGYDESTGDWNPSIGSETLTENGAPTLQSGGLNGYDYLSYDGVDDTHLNSNITLNQPDAIVVVARSIQGDDTVRLISGTASERQFVGGRGSGFAAWAGTWLDGGSSNTSWNIIVGLLDGASSAVRLNGSELATGDAGANALNGLQVAAELTDSAYTEADIAEVWLMGSPSTDDIQTAENYLNDKYAVY